MIETALGKGMERAVRAERRPRVSIGLPVFNGERYLEQALRGILAQTLQDFELIISDNASTDRTQEICRSFAAGDRRIRYSRNDRNIGGGNNFNRTFLLSAGEYFFWCTYDDKVGPFYAARCVEILDAHPEVVLCYSRIAEMDADGNAIGVEDAHDARSPAAFRRFRKLAAIEHSCQAIYGMARAEAMRKTLLWLNHTDSDRTYLAELSLHGQFYQIQEPLFYRRNYSGNSIRKYPNWRERMEWFDPRFRERVSLPHCAQWSAYLRIIWRSPVSPYQRFRCYLYMGHWLLLERHGRYMLKDLILAAVWGAHRVLRRISALRVSGSEVL